ncbi:MAG: glycosyltransferase family 39 protein [Pseudobdellovibrio sp.]
MKNNLSDKHLFWIFLFLITLLRLRVSTQFGLGVDEAHYVLYGKILDWSYFDHPPLVGWVQGLFQLLPMDHLIKARLPAILISILTSQLIYNYLISKKITARHALYALFVLNLTPMFNAMSIALLPDTLLMPLTLLIIIQTEKVLESSTLTNWALMGLWLGLAGLSKYTAVLYILALVLIFIFKKQFRELLKINLWIGVLIALALISPVLYWNVQNNFVSFQYQANHVLTLDASILNNISASFGMQMLSWGFGPFFIALAAYAGLIKNFKREKDFLITLIFLTVFLAFFIYVSIAEVLLPHWMLIYFILSIPVGYAYFLKNYRLKKTLISSFVISALISLILLFELAFKILPTEKTAALYEGIHGWDNIMSMANERLYSVSNPKKSIAVMNWTLGSRAMYYSTTSAEVFVIDSRFDQFDIWAPKSHIGDDVIVVIEAHKKDENLAHLNCAQIAAVGELTNTIKGVPVNSFLYYHCANFLGYKE